MDNNTLELLRKLYADDSSRWLYFAINHSDEYKQRIGDLFIETWSQVPEEFKERIIINLEFIICKNVEEYVNTGNTPGCTLLNKINRRCFIIFNPYPALCRHQTNVHFLAHELAHAYYNHPEIGAEYGSREEELKFVEEIAEPEAYKLVESIWKIYPDPDDIYKLSQYQKYILKN